MSQAIITHLNQTNKHTKKLNFTTSAIAPNGFNYIELKYYSNWQPNKHHVMLEKFVL